MKLKKISQEELNKILENHKLWISKFLPIKNKYKPWTLCQEDNPSEANLTEANLSNSNLIGIAYKNTNFKNTKLINTILYG